MYIFMILPKTENSKIPKSCTNKFNDSNDASDFGIRLYGDEYWDILMIVTTVKIGINDAVCEKGIMCKMIISYFNAYSAPFADHTEMPIIFLYFAKYE